ncbi:GNAT family N-acetyltransferase [Spongisporangium articulatum]|uniref:GNAT family N-acetyltransferase n=1 Tax=Spongisporangium articulatum TaxID=3362603 RepID=A0ABW8AQ90_9ACTN
MSTDWNALVGTRVVARVRSPNGLYDVLGDLIGADDDLLRIVTKRGERQVPRANVIAGGPVPPAPSRAAPPHRALSVGDLEVVMADHWRAPETDWLGGWLLRAAGGFTRRANSALAVGEPGMPLDVAVLEVTDWYSDRGMTPLAATPHPTIDEEDAGQLLAAAEAFRAAGWQEVPGAGATVLTAPTGEVRAPRDLPAGLTLDLLEAPDAAWLARYHYRGEAVPPVGRELLASAPEQVFAAVRDGGTTVAVARGSLARRWAGVTAVEVDPAYRRRGLGAALVARLGEWAWQHRAAAVYVQVGEGNEAGFALYGAAGFETHHTYAYLTPTSP